MQRLGNRFYKTIVILWLTLSLGSIVLAALSWVKLNELLKVGIQVTVIHDDLNEILKLMLDSETGMRGYVITGNTNFLELYLAAKTSLPPRFDELVEFSRDNSTFIKAVMVLRGKTELSLDWQRKAVESRQRDFKLASDLIATGEGNRIMDGIRAQVAELDQLQIAERSQIRQQFKKQISRAGLTSLGAAIVGAGAGIIAFWLTQVALKQQRRERDLLAAKLQAEHSNQEKTAFMANMSHEIRTPMNAIVGFSEILQNELRDPRHRQYLQSIRTSAGSLLLLINDILDMSKIESGKLELHPEPTDLQEICDFLQTLFSEATAKKKLKLECHVAEHLPHALLLDRIRLRQILVNLVGNAVKFTDQGGVEVRVKWEKEDTSSHVTLIIEVQDTGVGIPQDRLESIFKPFVQAGVHREKEKQGTGLGLSIVKRLTETMGGTATVASVLEQGSVFHLRFPHVPISARLAVSAKSKSIGEVNFNQLRPATLLVVDDNEVNCQLIAGMFNGSHHRLFFGSSGEQAVTKARLLKPDILLLDVRMPGIGGYKALEEIRKIPALEFLPIIAVTASNLMSEDSSLKERFSGFVRKPFTQRELFDELADFLPQISSAEPGREPGDSARAEIAPPAFAPAAPELIAHLRLLLIEPWPAIRDSVAINESKVFAKKLEDLGRHGQCEPLVAYAQKLLRDAENYAVTDLEKHLGEFAALVEQLDGGPQA